MTFLDDEDDIDNEDVCQDCEQNPCICYIDDNNIYTEDTNENEEKDDIE